MNTNTKTALQILADLYADWHSDRQLQCRMPLRHAWRGCLGLAAAVNGFDQHAIDWGGRVLLPNHAFNWLVMRDLPAGRCPDSPDIHRHGATFVNTAKATLAYGLPRIDFSPSARDTWDFKRSPIHPLFLETGTVPRPDILNARNFGREWAILNRISALMTAFGFHGRDQHGYSVRRPCTRGQSAATSNLPVLQAARWMPRAYLAFPRVQFYNFTRRNAVAHRSRGGILIIDLNRNVVLVPADAASRFSGIRPSALWWDVTPSAAFLDCGLESFVFPPLAIPTWDYLRWPLPGHVELQASIRLPLEKSAPVASTGESHRMLGPPLSCGETLVHPEATLSGAAA